MSIERGKFAGWIRYAIQVNNKGHSSLNEYVIGNGLIVSTSYGSGGYFSYPNRLKSKEWDQNSSIGRFSDNRMGICHNTDVACACKKWGTAFNKQEQVFCSIDCQIQIRLVRDADIGLYGTTDDSKGKKEDTF